MNETQKALLSGVLKIAGTALVAHGYMDAADASVFATAAEAVIGGVITIGAMIWSHRRAQAVDVAKATGTTP